MSTKTVNNTDPRISQILDFIIQLASGNWEAELSSEKQGDELDAIIVGLKMLAEELQFNSSERDKAEKALQYINNKLEQEVTHRTVEYKKAKEKAERANFLKSEFLANMSHELQTPLHAILSFSKFGIDKIDGNSQEKNLHFYKQINKSGKRLMSRLNDLLDIATLEVGKELYKIESVNLWQLTKNIFLEMEPLLKKKCLDVRLSDFPEQTKVYCDKNKIAQVIRNLLSNSIKYTIEKDTIEILFQTSHLQIGQNSCPALKFSISDAGVGIPDEELDQIFDKYNQSSRTNTGAGGTGLGLAICKEIIEAHQGKIFANNNPETGATFCFFLPYRHEETQ